MLASRAGFGLATLGLVLPALAVTDCGLMFESTIERTYTPIELAAGAGTGGAGVVIPWVLIVAIAVGMLAAFERIRPSIRWVIGAGITVIVATWMLPLAVDTTTDSVDAYVGVFVLVTGAGGAVLAAVWEARGRRFRRFMPVVYLLVLMGTLIGGAADPFAWAVGTAYLTAVLAIDIIVQGILHLRAGDRARTAGSEPPEDPTDRRERRP